MKQIGSVVLWAAVLAMVIAKMAAAASPITLEPHRAIYDIVLAGSSGPSALRSAEGRLVLELSDACEGYIFNQRFVVRWGYEEGREVLSDYIVATWEAKEGTAFRFDSSTRLNGEVTKRYRGKARLDAAGRSGRAVFSRPDLPDLPLAAGTMFPGEHLRELIGGAMSGEQQLTRQVYDGNGPEGLFQAVAFFSREIAADAGAMMLIRDVVSWPVRIAYYPLRDEREATQTAEVPELESGYRLYANGVASSFVLDYGDTVLKGTLVELSAVSSAC